MRWLHLGDSVGDLLITVYNCRTCFHPKFDIFSSITMHICIFSNDHVLAFLVTQSYSGVSLL